MCFMLANLFFVLLKIYFLGSFTCLLSVRRTFLQQNGRFTATVQIFVVILRVSVTIIDILLCIEPDSTSTPEPYSTARTDVVQWL